MNSHNPNIYEEPFLRWMKREWCLILITIGIGLDWLPSVLSTQEADPLAQLSGTKLMIIPGLAIAMIAKRDWIIRPHVLGVAYLVALFIGGGTGWLVGNVEMSRLVAIGVNGLIFLYFLKLRSLISIKRILAISFVLAVFIPLVQWLTLSGVIASGKVDVGTGFVRVFSIFDSTTVGFAPLLLAACLGGLIFVRTRKERNVLNALIAVCVMILGLTGALLAAQRSGVVAYAVSLLTALVLYTISERKRLVWVIKLSLIIGVSGFAGILLLGDVASSVRTRFTDSSAFSQASELRYGGFIQFISDLSNPLDLIPKGHESLFNRTGVEPHLLLSEAYYEGGPLFLAVLIVILVKFGFACLSLARSSDAAARTIGICLCAFGSGAAIQLSLQTALVLRLLPLVLGAGIAAHRLENIQAEYRRINRNVLIYPGSSVIKAGAE